ncbi:phage minor head protein [Sulfurimonas sp.]|uniref:phage minor head protein n=1 Tax=Sulfurimonas sp. TaxID=2022749 RepID=UPI0025EA6AF8|nr:phage minor head protein [Sulfurimonas sp.]
MPKSKIDFNPLKPDEAISYIKGKGLNLTYDYEEMMHQAHHKAFTVAKITRLDLLSDMHEAVQTAIKDGTPFETFKKNIKPTLQKKGWYGTKEITDPKTGKTKEVYIGSRRLKNILNTNKEVAYAVGRYKQQSGFKLATFLQYRALQHGNRRDDHKSKHGVILPREHIWWSTNYPPNGWGCKCYVTAHTKKEIDKKGWKVHQGKLENIAHKDWSYNVGATNKLSGLSKINLDKSLQELPKSSKNKAYEKLDQDKLLGLFYQKMGVKKGDTFLDKVGDPMVIDDNLFLDKKTKELKIMKMDRHLFLDEFTKTIKEPDEIYLEFDDFGLKKNMFRYINVDGKKKAILTVFRYFKDANSKIKCNFLKVS